MVQSRLSRAPRVLWALKLRTSLQIKTIKTRVFKERENLYSFILRYVKKLPEKSILVITSKIVALSEGRTIIIDPKIPYQKFKEKIVKQEGKVMARRGNTLFQRFAGQAQW